jgi:hypothetical protein
MDCRKHPGREAIAVCQKHEAGFCRECCECMDPDYCCEFGSERIPGGVPPGKRANDDDPILENRSLSAASGGELHCLDPGLYCKFRTRCVIWEMSRGRRTARSEEEG